MSARPQQRAARTVGGPNGAAHQRVLMGLEAFVAAVTAHRGGAR